MRALLLRTLVGLALAPALAIAQAIPSPSAPKRAATNAANRMSSAIERSQNTGEPQAPAKQATPTRTATPQTKTAAPQTKSATPPTKTAAPQTKTAAPQTKTAAPAPAPTQPAPARLRQEVVLTREVFDYQSEARRDPFFSLVTSSELRPTVNDLRLVAVAFDATGRNSVAVMRDITTKEQYRVKVGQTLGRMRVAQIQPKAVVFSIEEFGYNRQEILALGDTTRARTP